MTGNSGPKAGRILDETLALILGWQKDPKKGGWRLRTKGDETRCIPGPPRFSQDIADAWRMVEAMGPCAFEVGYHPSGCFCGGEGDIPVSPHWYARFEGMPIEVQGDTAPEAIARAFLQAMMMS